MGYRIVFANEGFFESRDLIELIVGIPRIPGSLQPNPPRSRLLFCLSRLNPNFLQQFGLSWFDLMSFLPQKKERKLILKNNAQTQRERDLRQRGPKSFRREQVLLLIFKGGPEPPEKEIHEILGSKRKLFEGVLVHP